MTKKIIQQLILIAFVFIGVIFVFVNYFYSPLVKKEKMAIDTLNSIETKLVDTKRRALELPKLRAEMEFLQNEVADLEKLLPKQTDMPSIIRVITKKAQQHGLEISSISPIPAVVQPKYNEIPFQIVLTGQYHNLASFAADIGQQTRLMSIQNITFSYRAPGLNDRKNISANFLLAAYTYRE